MDLDRGAGREYSRITGPARDCSRLRHLLGNRRSSSPNQLKNKCKVKGGGQECPPHTILGKRKTPFYGGAFFVDFN